MTTSTHGLRAWVWLAVVLALAGCAASLAHPTERDAGWASGRWPGTTLADLQRGRSLFVSRCGGCHTLPQPESRPPEAWPKLAGDMADDARLGPAEMDLVVRFLSATSARTRGARGPGLGP